MMNDNVIEEAPTASIFEKIDKIINQSIKLMLVTTLALMSVLIVYQVFCRYILNSPSNVSSELLTYMLIWLGILGASVCFLQDKHLNLPIILDKISEDNQDTLVIITIVTSILFSGIVAYSGVIGLDNQSFTPILKMNQGLLQSVIIILGIVMGVSYFIKLSNVCTKNSKNKLKTIVVSIVLGVLVFSYSSLKANEFTMGYIENHIELISFFVLFISFFFFFLLVLPSLLV